jgi:hypothetical protein
MQQTNHDVYKIWKKEIGNLYMLEKRDQYLWNPGRGLPYSTDEDRKWQLSVTHFMFNTLSLLEGREGVTILK